jgi:hypothetical protein
MSIAPLLYQCPGSMLRRIQHAFLDKILPCPGKLVVKLASAGLESLI